MTDNNQFDEMSPISTGLPPGVKPHGAQPTNEYKVGHNKPPLFLIVCIY